MTPTTSMEPLCTQICAILNANRVGSTALAPPPAAAAMSIGQKHRYTADLSLRVKALGYPGELGYAQLLYPSERDAANIIEWLEAFFLSSKQQQQQRGGGAGAGAAEDEDHRDENAKKEASSARGWKGVALALETWMSTKTNAAVVAVEGGLQRNILLTTQEREEHHEEPEHKHHERRARRNPEEESQDSSDIGKRERDARARYYSVQARLGRVESAIRGNEFENARLVELIRVREKARLLSRADAVGNLKQLQQLVQASKLRLCDLVSEWELHRQPLIQSLNEANAKHDVQRRAQRQALADISEARKELQGIQERLLEEDGASASTPPTTAATASVKRSETRNQIIARVLDSIRQVKKQVAEIERIAEDVRTVQRDVNLASEGMLAVEKETDELIFSLARRVPMGVDAYEFLQEVRERFDELLQLEHDNHLIDMETRDITTRCHSLAARVSVMDTTAILRDLEQVRAENAQLHKAMGKKS